MRVVFSKLVRILRETPALLLLFFVFLFIIPRSLSYDNAWVQPEQFFIKWGILSTGANLNLQDLKNGLNWPLFEYQPRSTRPLASYFEILDTKFRVWLWHYIPPHPSLSLTWIFSLILGPIFLYKLLRNSNIGINVAVAMVSFYLVTPGVLSYEVMLYRSAKPMANFFIIFCLYAASVLKRKFIDNGETIPFRNYAGFWFLVAFSFYWDEISWIIFPAIFFIFPRIIKPKIYLLLWLLLPLITLISYFKIIPFLSMCAGFPFPHFSQSLKFYNGLAYADVINQRFGPICYFIKVLGPNTKNLILETMGIILPKYSKDPLYVIVNFYSCLFAWGVICYYLCKVRKKLDLILPFLFGLILFFNYWISINLRIWGPYCYGTFWPIFFVIYLSRFINKANIPKNVLTICLFFILLSMFNCFLATNLVYKKYHYYPYSPGLIRDYYYAGSKSRFVETPAFRGKNIKEDIIIYWTQVRSGTEIEPFSLPKELCWLPLELEPERKHERYMLLSDQPKDNIPLLTAI